MRFYAAPELFGLTEPRYTATEVGWFTEKNDSEDLAESDCESAIIAAGRVCYRSYNSTRPPEEYIENLLKKGHGSVLEHAVVGVLVKGVSRSLTHELIRHRHFSFSQESQRFVDAEPEFVIPPLILKMGGRDLEDFKRYCKVASATYSAWCGALPGDKAGKEAARSLLPNCTATRIAITGNLRAWRNFILTRGVRGADAEMVRFARAVLEFMQGEAPNVFADCTVDAEGFVKSEYGKV